VSARTNGKDVAGRRRRARRRRAAQPAALAAAAGGESLAALQAEVVLLREENARLKSAAHRDPDLGLLLDRARSMPGLGGRAEDHADEAAQLLTEGMVMREALLALCRELAQSMDVMEHRLERLGAAMDEARGAGPAG
jgi:hypothetical protein